MKTRTKVFYGTLFAVLVMTAPLAAQARPFDHGYGQGQGGPGYGWHQSIPQEQREAVWKLMQQHREKMQPIRDKLWTKSRTLDALSANPNVQPKELTALVDEISGLRAQLRDQHKAFADQVKKETGVDMPGAWCGMGGGGPKGHRGYGHRGPGGHHGGSGQW